MILELLSSSAVGTALGGLFSWLNRVEERKTLAEKQAHERDMLGLQAEAAMAQSKAALDQTRVAGELRAFQSSVETGRERSGIRWVDAVISLMRPGLTLLLFGLTVWLAIRLSRQVDGIEGIPTTDAVELWRHLVYELVFLASTAMAWWFGARGSSPRRQ